MMSRPETQAVSFRIQSEKVDELERLAKATDRPRSWHIEQALDAYLDLQTWQVAQTRQSMAEMDAGYGIPHEDIKKELLSWGKGPKKKRAG
jgi:predicted transcriptional regulator